MSQRDGLAHPGAAVGRCDACGKLSYPSRKAAKRAAAARRAQAGSLSAYPCRANDQAWHVGHLPQAVRNGTLDKDEWVPHDKVR